MLASNLQDSTSCDSVSLEYKDAAMLDYNPEGDINDQQAICYGAVSLKLTVQKIFGAIYNAGIIVLGVESAAWRHRYFDNSMHSMEQIYSTRLGQTVIRRLLPHIIRGLWGSKADWYTGPCYIESHKPAELIARTELRRRFVFRRFEHSQEKSKEDKTCLRSIS